MLGLIVLNVTRKVSVICFISLTCFDKTWTLPVLIWGSGQES